MELAKKTETLAKEQKLTVASMVKILEEAATEWTELTKKHYEEVEQAKMVLDKVQTTYQTKLQDYEVQAKVTTTLMKKLKGEKQATKDGTKLGVERIQMMVSPWKDRTKTIYIIVQWQCGTNGRNKWQNFKYSE